MVDSQDPLSISTFISDIPAIIQKAKEQTLLNHIENISVCDIKLEENLDRGRELIPMYFGSISPNLCFLYFGVRIVHLLLISWGGGAERTQKDLMSGMGRDLVVGTSRAVAKLLQCGVEHGDARPSNVLWNPESKKAVLVDFGRSEAAVNSPGDITQQSEAEAPIKGYPTVRLPARLLVD
jgi:hypothetical protein